MYYFVLFEGRLSCSLLYPSVVRGCVGCLERNAWNRGDPQFLHEYFLKEEGVIKTVSILNSALLQKGFPF